MRDNGSPHWKGVECICYLVLCILTVVFKLHCWGFRCVYTCQRNISVSRSAMFFVCTFGVVHLEATLEGKFQPQTSTGSKQRSENMGEVWELKLTILEGRVWSHLGWGPSVVWLWSFFVFTEGDQQSITAVKVTGRPYILLKGKHSHPKTQTQTQTHAHTETHTQSRYLHLTQSELIFHAVLFVSWSAERSAQRGQMTRVQNVRMCFIACGLYV